MSAINSICLLSTLPLYISQAFSICIMSSVYSKKFQDFLLISFSENSPRNPMIIFKKKKYLWCNILRKNWVKKNISKIFWGLLRLSARAWMEREEESLPKQILKGFRGFQRRLRRGRSRRLLKISHFLENLLPVVALITNAKITLYFEAQKLFYAPPKTNNFRNFF